MTQTANYLRMGAANVSERVLAPPQLAISTVIFALDVATDVASSTSSGTEASQSALYLPLVRRTRPPYLGMWALPGGPLHYNQSLEDAAHANLKLTTGLTPSYLEQLYTFGDLGRSQESAERLVSIVYWALVPTSHRSEEESDEEGNVRWFNAREIGELAFDHNRIVDYALWRLRTKMTYADIAYRFLGEKFTLAQVRQVYEAVLDERVDPANFRRRLKHEPGIVATEEMASGARHRPARLYQYLPSTDVPTELPNCHSHDPKIPAGSPYKDQPS